MPPELERRISTIEGLEVRESESSVDFRGYAAVFGQWSEPLFGFREQIASGAFKKTLGDGADVRMLVNHDGVPIARSTSGTLKLSEDSKGLLAEANLDRANPTVAELSSAMKRGDLSQMSFAFRTIRDEWDESDPKNVRRTVREASLQNGDVSPVTYPAYPQTTAELRARFEDRASVDDSSWDGNAAMGACKTASDYRSICAGEREQGDPDQRQHWALPHHFLGKGPNAAGVRNALSRLPQTQGLTNADAARSHLEAHMAAIHDAEGNSLYPDALEARLVMLIEESRVGKVFSAANANAIQSAIDTLTQMLLDAGYPVEDDDADDSPTGMEGADGYDTGQDIPPQANSLPLIVIQRRRALSLAAARYTA